MSSSGSPPPVKKKRRRCSKENIHRQEETLSNCHVCGVTLDRKHLNYGAVACYSCRAFFRRVHQASMDLPDFQCKQGGGCIVNEKSRRKCKRCRYDACVSSGMKSEAVLKEDQRMVIFKKGSYKSKEEKAAIVGSKKDQDETEPPNDDTKKKRGRKKRKISETATPTTSGESIERVPSPLPREASPGQQLLEKDLWRLADLLRQYNQKSFAGLSSSYSPPLGATSDEPQGFMERCLSLQDKAWDKAYSEYKVDINFVLNMVQFHQGQCRLSQPLLWYHLTKLGLLFKTFAEGQAEFQSLSLSDQFKLIQHNRVLFIQHMFSQYLLQPTGLGQIQMLLLTELPPALALEFESIGRVSARDVDLFTNVNQYEDLLMQVGHLTEVSSCPMVASLILYHTKMDMGLKSAYIADSQFHSLYNLLDMPKCPVSMHQDQVMSLLSVLESVMTFAQDNTAWEWHREPKAKATQDHQPEVESHQHKNKSNNHSQGQNHHFHPDSHADHSQARHVHNNNLAQNELTNYDNPYNHSSSYHQHGNYYQGGTPSPQDYSLQHHSHKKLDGDSHQEIESTRYGMGQHNDESRLATEGMPNYAPGYFDSHQQQCEAPSPGNFAPSNGTTERYHNQHQRDSRDKLTIPYNTHPHENSFEPHQSGRKEPISPRDFAHQNPPTENYHNHSQATPKQVLTVQSNSIQNEKHSDQPLYGNQEQIEEKSPKDFVLKNNISEKNHNPHQEEPPHQSAAPSNHNQHQDQSWQHSGGNHMQNPAHLPSVPKYTTLENRNQKELQERPTTPVDSNQFSGQLKQQYAVNQEQRSPEHSVQENFAQGNTQNQHQVEPQHQLAVPSYSNRFGNRAKQNCSMNQGQRDQKSPSDFSHKNITPENYYRDYHVPHPRPDQQRQHLTVPFDTSYQGNHPHSPSSFDQETYNRHHAHYTTHHQTQHHLPTSYNSNQHQSHPKQLSDINQQEIEALLPMDHTQQDTNTGGHYHNPHQAIQTSHATESYNSNQHHSGTQQFLSPHRHDKGSPLQRYSSPRNGPPENYYHDQHPHHMHPYPPPQYPSVPLNSHNQGKDPPPFPNAHHQHHPYQRQRGNVFHHNHYQANGQYQRNQDPLPSYDPPPRRQATTARIQSDPFPGVSEYMGDKVSIESILQATNEINQDLWQQDQLKKAKKHNIDRANGGSCNYQSNSTSNMSNSPAKPNLWQEDSRISKDNKSPYNNRSNNNEGGKSNGFNRIPNNSKTSAQFAGDQTNSINNHNSVGYHGRESNYDAHSIQNSSANKGNWQQDRANKDENFNSNVGNKGSRNFQPHSIPNIPNPSAQSEPWQHDQGGKDLAPNKGTTHNDSNDNNNTIGNNYHSKSVSRISNSSEQSVILRKDLVIENKSPQNSNGKGNPGNLHTKYIPNNSCPSSQSGLREQDQASKNDYGNSNSDCGDYGGFDSNSQTDSPLAFRNPSTPSDMEKQNWVCKAKDPSSSNNCNNSNNKNNDNNCLNNNSKKHHRSNSISRFHNSSALTSQ